MLYSRQDRARLAYVLQKEADAVGKSKKGVCRQQGVLPQQEQGLSFPLPSSTCSMRRYVCAFVA